MHNPLRTQKQSLFIAVAVILLLSSLQSICYARGRSKLYWSERSKISRADLDGSNVQDVITDRYLIEDIAIDTQNGYIFWVETDVAEFKGVQLGTATILRADPNGSNTVEIHKGYKLPLEGGSITQDCNNGVCETFITPEGQAGVKLDPEQLFVPLSITVDTQNSHIYWTDRSIARFEKADIDGTNLEESRKILGLKATDIEYELMDNKLYWNDGSKIKKMDIDANQIDTVIEIRHRTILNFDLDVKADHIYFSLSASGTIYRSDADGKDVQEIITDLKEPYNIVVDAEARKLYWSSWDRKANLYKIQQSNLDGSDVTDIITDLDRVLGLVLDTEGIYAVSPAAKLTTTWGNLKVQ